MDDDATPAVLRLNTQLGQAGQESSGMRTTEAMAADLLALLGFVLLPALIRWIER